MRIAISFSVGALVLIAGGNIFVISAETATGIDALIWPNAEVFEADSMAYGSAVKFLLLAFCLLCLCYGGEGRPPVCQWVATIGLISSVIALVGYAFGSATLYEVYAFSAMALHTAACFFLLFTAVLLAQPQRGWVGILMSEGMGGKSARRLLPVLVLGPLFMCFLMLKATEIWRISENFRLSLLAISMTGVLVVTVLRNARIENATEREIWTFRRRLDEAAVEREAVTREASHRIKNDLQQITAFVDMERSRLQDPAACSVLQSLSGRVRALGLIHTNLLNHSEVTHVSIDHFLRDLVTAATEAYGLRERGIELDAEVTEAEVPLEVAVSIGLLANELLMNAVKHAFPDDARGRIRISFEKAVGDEYVFSCSDNGVGMTELARPGTGSRIVRAILRQLQGREESCSDGSRRGACRHVVLPGRIVEGGLRTRQVPAA